jgi:hypothetical protein
MRVLQTIGFGLALISGGYVAGEPAAETHYALRGYREFTESTRMVGDARSSIEVKAFVFETPERASIFASKIYSDYELTVGNTLVTLDAAKGPVDAISLSGTGFIVPLIEHDGKQVHVLIGADQGALKAQADLLLKGTPLRSTELKHPEFMDKWDRYCLGVWNRLSDLREDPTHKTVDSFYTWMGKIGLNPQLCGITESADLSANDNQLRWLRKYLAAEGVHYQNVEWLQAFPDLYNRNPFLSTFDGPGMMSQWSYYGEVPHAPGLLRDVQHAPILKELQDYTKDDGLMAILDPDGEIGPFQFFYWGEYGPVQRRNFVRYLKEVRHFTLADVSRRYYGKPGALQSWDDVTMADWRTFYGWDEGSVDLAGEWRVMREGDTPGLRAGWQSPAFNDDDWIRLTYPGDTTLYTIPDPSNPKPYWMRRTITVNPAKFPGTIYLTIAPLGQEPVHVFVNGKRLGVLAPRFFTGRIFGQFEVTQMVHDSPKLVVALRFGSNDIPSGPMFLTSKAIQDFPTEDPILNARRYDHFDFIDWAVADSVGSMLKQIRTVDPDRPIKVHAYADSPWGWKQVQELGGYSHHTGAGAGWSYTVPKQYGLARETQDSAETGGSQETPRNIKGLFGNLAFMGKNAHDYFYNLQDISKDPKVLEWFVNRLPDIKVMGRVNVNETPIACIRGLRSNTYVGEFYKTESWRQGYDMVKGGEMQPLLDEVRIDEGHLPYPAILDEGTVVWDEEMAAQLEKYVKEGGTLFLAAPCGLHTPIKRNAYPGAVLAGVRIGDKMAPDLHVALTVADPVFGNKTGDVGQYYPSFMSDAHELTPLAGTEVIGTTPDGKPAVTRRVLGQGAVYYCAGGLWPKTMQEEIGEHFGIKVFVTKEGKGVDQMRTSRSNNGCEDLLMLRGLGGREATIHWTFDYPPTAIYNPVTGAPISATIEGNTATFTVKIDDWDFAWYASRRPDASEQFSHWLLRQSQMWQGLSKGAPLPEPPLFRTVDLNREWKLVQTDSQADAERRMKLDDKAAGLVPTDLGWWSAPGTGLKSGPGVFGLYRRDFTLPVGWEKKSTIELSIDGRVYNWPQVGFGGPSEVFLNGTQIWSGDKIDKNVCLDLTANIKPGANRLEIVHQGEGILAEISLLRTVKPDTTVDLAGDWQAVDGLQSVRTVQLPGKVKTSFLYRDIMVPKEQAGREVWVRVDTEDARSSNFVIVNGRERYPVARGDASRPMEVNITPEIRFGETNRILIGSGSMGGGWKVGEHNFLKLELGFYAPGRWAADGKGIEAALTAKELEGVKQQEARVKLFPLVQTALNKPPVNLFPFSNADAQAYVPPTPAIDLDLSAAGGAVTDRGPNHVPVTVQGKTETFSERGGAVTGLRMYGEDSNRSYLSLPNQDMVKLLTDKPFTICTWFKPMLDKDDQADLWQWGLSMDLEVTRKGLSYICNDQANVRMAASEIMTPRQWHFLSVTVEGTHSTLYVDGLNVAEQTWNSPLGEGRVPFIIGGTLRSEHSFNMKLASFTVYSEVLDDASVGKLYVKDKARFESTPDKVWPEDYLTRFVFTDVGVTDGAEFPAQLTLDASTTPKIVDGRPVLDFNGHTSTLLIKENPNIHLLGKPFSMIFDINPTLIDETCLFRRYHNIGLWVRKDGSLVLDANIGQHNQLVFPGVVTDGKWNRIMLTYDGQTAAIFRDGALVDRKSYPGSLSINRDFQLSFGADNTFGKSGFVGYTPMQLREFEIYPRVLEAMPPAP